MDLGVRDKVALATGASSGIGAAPARVLAEEGAHVVAAYGRETGRALRCGESRRHQSHEESGARAPVGIFAMALHAAWSQLAEDSQISPDVSP